ncbi:hypothetical protein JYU34_017481, partial [Plutella xylostella]
MSRRNISIGAESNGGGRPGSLRPVHRALSSPRVAAAPGDIYQSGRSLVCRGHARDSYFEVYYCSTDLSALTRQSVQRLCDSVAKITPELIIPEEMDSGVVMMA